MEYHYKKKEEMDQPPAKEMLKILQQLEQRSLRVFNIEPNYW